MNILHLPALIPAELADHSRVWIYQSNRPFIEREEAEINEQLLQFYSQWQAHGAPVRGWAKLLFRQFVVVIADETNVQVSGCSTDASVRVVKSIERQYDVNMFDRMMLTFLVNEKAEMLPLNQVQYALEKGYINWDTPLFNNLVNTKQELLSNWLIPLKDSWLASRLVTTA
ncbi:hypothetical protein CAP35_10685 [Chitinophagaceae bacterium IBVUCB1]|nr:hypothetical protein CAP35_10685 [Chitinophagaceae bacterium IBVUCB1]